MVAIALAVIMWLAAGCLAWLASDALERRRVQLHREHRNTSLR